jgi:hypothetical protein
VFEVKVEPGVNYVLIPSTFKPEQSREVPFFFKVACSSKVTVTKHK